MDKLGIKDENGVEYVPSLDDMGKYIDIVTDTDGNKIRVIYIERENIITTEVAKKVLTTFINGEFKEYISQTLGATTKNVNQVIEDFQKKLEDHTNEQLQESMVEILSKRNSGEFEDRLFEIYQKGIDERLDARLDKIITERLDAKGTL